MRLLWNFTGSRQGRLWAFSSSGIPEAIAKQRLEFSKIPPFYSCRDCPARAAISRATFFGRKMLRRPCHYVVGLPGNGPVLNVHRAPVFDRRDLIPGEKLLLRILLGTETDTQAVIFETDL